MTTEMLSTEHIAIHVIQVSLPYKFSRMVSILSNMPKHVASNMLCAEISLRQEAIRKIITKYSEPKIYI